MSERKARPLRVELITCISITVCGLNLNRSFFPGTLWQRILPFVLILGLILCVLVFFLDVTKGTEEELDREGRDERNLMIWDRASCFCWRVENVVLILVMVGFFLFNPTYLVCFVLYWVVVLRYWLLFLTRWWLNRKY